MSDVSAVNDLEQVTNIIKAYFDGLHNADVEKLNSIFHNDVFLKSPGQRRSIKQWLGDVACRDVPDKLGHAFNYNILWIDIEKDQAMVKLECPLFSHSYIDYLGLLKEQGDWLIVNKMYTDVENY